MAEFFKTLPNSGIRLRDDAVKMWYAPYQPTSDVGLRNWLGTTRWWKNDGITWTPTNLSATSACSLPPGGSAVYPWCVITPTSTTVQEVTVAYNFGWQIGDSMYGFSSFGGGASEFGRVDGASWSYGYAGSKKLWRLRQIVYNSTRNETAIRVSTSSTASQSDIDLIASGSGISGTTSISFFGTANRFGSYLNGPDYTGVWVYSGSWISSSAFALLTTYKN